MTSAEESSGEQFREQQMWRVRPHVTRDFKPVYDARFLSSTNTQYMPGEVLGSGSDGIVSKVTSPDGKKAFALKVIKIVRTGKKSHMDTESFAKEVVQRMINMSWEVDILRKQNHPNIVRFVENLDHALTLGPPWCGFIQEYMPYTLYDLGSGNIPGFEVSDETINFQFFKQLTQALIYIHQQDLVHMDVKPTNILVTPPTVLSRRRQNGSFTFKLCDFGHARYLSESDRTGGTWLYAPAEAHGWGSGAVCASDIHSLAVTTLWLVAVDQMRDIMNTAEPKSKQGSEALLARYRHAMENNVLLAEFVDCLDDDPASRPSALELSERQEDLICFGRLTLDKLRKMGKAK